MAKSRNESVKTFSIGYEHPSGRSFNELDSDRWLREDLREMAHDLLSDNVSKNRGYVQPVYARWLLENHESGRRNFSDHIYALMVLELWYRGLREDASRRATSVAHS